MARLNFSGLRSMEIADILADGSFPDTGFQQLFGSKEGTFVLNVNEPDLTSIFVEETNVPFGTAVGNRETDFVTELLGVSTEQVAVVFGATYTAATSTDPEKVEFPPELNTVFKAVRLSMVNGDGLPVVFKLPKVLFIASSAATVTKSDIVAFQVSGRIQIPTNAAGDAQNWMQIDVGNANS